MPEEVAVEAPKVPIDLAEEKAKPRLVAILFFDYANETADRKLNLAGVFDRLFVDREKKRSLPFGVFVRTAETFDSPINVIIVSPENKVAGGFAFTVPKEAKVAEGKEYAMVQLMGRVQFDAPVEGTYWFDVSFEGKSLGGSPFKVEFRDLKELEDGITRGDA